jgi:hypothetical protein
MCLHLSNIGHIIYVLDLFFDMNSMMVSILGLDNQKRKLACFISATSLNTFISSSDGRVADVDEYPEAEGN